MPKPFRHSRHLRHAALLAFAIVAGYAAQPISERVGLAHVHSGTPTHACVT